MYRIYFWKEKDFFNEPTIVIVHLISQEQEMGKEKLKIKIIIGARAIAQC